MQRSLSQDKKLSNTSRSKMISPSPNKKNSWKEDKTEEKPNNVTIPKANSNSLKTPINKRTTPSNTNKDTLPS